MKVSVGIDRGTLWILGHYTSYLCGLLIVYT